MDSGAFAGLIDEVRVYNIALTPAQVQTDMATPVASAASTTAPSAPSGPLPQRRLQRPDHDCAELGRRRQTRPSTTWHLARRPAAGRRNESGDDELPARHPVGNGTTYYWRVTSKGPGGTTAAPVWRFAAQPGSVWCVSVSSIASEPQTLRLLTWNVNGGNNQARGAECGRAGSPDGEFRRAGDCTSGRYDFHGRRPVGLIQTKLENATSRPGARCGLPTPGWHPRTRGQPVAEHVADRGFGDDGTRQRAHQSLRCWMRSDLAGWIAVVVNKVTVHIATTQFAVDATQRTAQLDSVRRLDRSGPDAEPDRRRFQHAAELTPRMETWRSRFQGHGTTIVKTAAPGIQQNCLAGRPGSMIGGPS